MNRVLVTGNLGYIGSVLTEKLIEKNLKLLVLILDIFLIQIYLKSNINIIR